MEIMPPMPHEHRYTKQITDRVPYYCPVPVEGAADGGAMGFFKPHSGFSRGPRLAALIFATCLALPGSAFSQDTVYEETFEGGEVPKGVVLDSGSPDGEVTAKLELGEGAKNSGQALDVTADLSKVGKFWHLNLVVPFFKGFGDVPTSKLKLVFDAKSTASTPIVVRMVCFPGANDEKRGDMGFGIIEPGADWKTFEFPFSTAEKDSHFNPDAKRITLFLGCSKAQAPAASEVSFSIDNLRVVAEP